MTFWKIFCPFPIDASSFHSLAFWRNMKVSHLLNWAENSQFASQRHPLFKSWNDCNVRLTSFKLIMLSKCIMRILGVSFYFIFFSQYTDSLLRFCKVYLQTWFHFSFVLQPDFDSTTWNWVWNELNLRIHVKSWIIWISSTWFFLYWNLLYILVWFCLTQLEIDTWDYSNRVIQILLSAILN